MKIQSNESNNIVDSLLARVSQNSVHETNNKHSSEINALEQSYLHNIHPEQAREFLANHINRKLQSEESNIVDLQYDYSQTLDNEKAVTSFLSNTILQSAGNHDSQAELQSRVSEGFDEVKEILRHSNSLPENLESEFTRIQHTLSDFIHRLNELASQGLNIDSNHYTNTSNSTIEIETRDGDIITIEIAKSLNMQQGKLELYDKQYNGSSITSLTDQSAGLNISVSGNLDENELASIRDLVKNIGRTASLFEKGDVNAALNSIINLQLNTDELSGFEFNIQTREQQKAVNIYRNTSQQQEQLSPQLLGQTAMLVGQAEQTTDLREIVESIRDMFEGFYQQLEQARKETTQSQPNTLLSNILSERA